MKYPALMAVFSFAFIVAFTCAVHAQSPSPTPAAADTASHIKRWFEIEQLTFATRYRYIRNANGIRAASQMQYQFVGKFRFKFDPKGRYSVAANVATGQTITSGWNNTGWGTGHTQRDLNLRQLYFDAKPDKHVEVQVGGLFVNYGENTEVVTLDNDTYITGERLQIRAPKKLYFDEVSVTYARHADSLVPNVFRRFRRFDKQNYHQFLVRKQVNKIVSFSADYTFISGQDTLHQALRFKLPKGKIVDTFLFENYERLDPDKSYGMNVFAEKALTKKLTISGGFADVHIPGFNGDRFPPGKRVYFNGVYKFTREFSLTTQLTQGVGTISPIVLPRTRVDVILSYNFLETLRRTKYF
jgi:hypothetical protein